MTYHCAGHIKPVIYFSFWTSSIACAHAWAHNVCPFTYFGSFNCKLLIVKSVAIKFFELLSATETITEKELKFQ